MTKYQDWLSISGIFLGCLLLFTWGLNTQEVIGFDSRFYLFAQEMWRHGPTFFPTSYHMPYPDYPGTSTFLIYLCAHLFGGVTKLAAIFPTAIAAAATVVMTYRIGLTQNRQWAWYGVFFLLLTFTFLKSARTITIDIYPMLITSICFYVMYVSESKNRSSTLCILYFLMALSFAFRGPIGLVIPAGVICGYYLVERKYKKCFWVGLGALVLLATLTCLFLALAYYCGGKAFVINVLDMEILGRLNNNPAPRFFYWVDSLKNYALSFPIALCVLFGLVSEAILNRRIANRFVLHLLAWTAVILIGMSIPGDKKPRYILSMMPAIALLAAYPFAIQPKQLFICKLTSGFKIFTHWSLLILLVLTGLIYWYTAQHHLFLPIHYTKLFLYLSAGQIILFGFHYVVSSTKWREVVNLSLTAGCFMMAYLMLAEPIELYIERANSFVTLVENKRLQAGADLVFYQEKKDYLPVKYLINTQQEVNPTFIFDMHQLTAIKQPTFFVTRAEHFFGLPKELQSHYKVIAQDTLGHVKVVVFERDQI